ncbi:hypothetical protein A3D77_04055 [Candidatus Gottesmanbacteria bacterium RIFCSPHIGHO2_02_FULL_39_11]|uniref:AI-2E family transporter n=1 Tax=Candidatus Gottesmanbacteria bacterium RIFCSPHIGHO2_02_FULL_39_11 TaxID=1798382 RepID=A0A1F5ZKN3_9BACT|nr:MAG: hypothetical protein A3D77_04055 [Candidatus Gottesmanbacteria bacterium RIFCSPHIGHO2_02_FULL_39_11]
MFPTKIEISHKTILFTIIILLSLWFVYHVLDILIFIFVAFILMSAFKPIVDFIESKKLPRIAGALIIYLLFLSVLGLLITILLPPVITQSVHFIDTLPVFIRNALPFINLDTQLISTQIAPLSQNIFKVTIDVFSNIITLFTIIVVSFYLLLERKHVSVYFKDLFGSAVGEKFLQGLEKVEERLGAWVRGQVMLGLIIGVMTFIALMILGLPYPLTLAIFAGILEVIPIIGPIISMIPAILIAVTISPLMAGITFASYLIIQQVEAHIVVPVMMKKVSGLPPIVTILSLMIGAKLGGIIGALLAIPLLITILTGVGEYLKFKQVKLKSAERNKPSV